MTEQESLMESAQRVSNTVPHWPGGLPENGDFTVRAKVWGDALNLAAHYLRARPEDAVWTKLGEGWKNSPPPHARYEVRRRSLGTFVATPCYGMHRPWWVPLVANEFAPGSNILWSDLEAEVLSPRWEEVREGGTIERRIRK